MVIRHFLVSNRSQQEKHFLYSHFTLILSKYVFVSLTFLAYQICRSINVIHVVYVKYDFLLLHLFIELLFFARS
jgi:hypothetical protein